MLSETAVVLGGGGSAGNAWEIGVIAGLFDDGLDVTKANLIIGTSAGATVAAQIMRTRPPELLADILTAVSRHHSEPLGPDRGHVPLNLVAEQMERTDGIIAVAENASDMRHRMCVALELDARTVPGNRSGATVAAHLPSAHWPQTPVLITAVDAHTAEPVVFDRSSGVELVDTVAASLTHHGVDRLGDRRSSEHADLAAGDGRVLVLSPVGGRSRHSLEWGTHLAAQVDEFRAGGSRVETIFPDSDAQNAMGFGVNVPATRPFAARTGDNQGRTLADQLTEFWRLYIQESQASASVG